MSGIYQILNTAKDAFLASQISMEVTGSNIANASTPGYVRQRAVLAAKSPGEVAGNAIAVRRGDHDHRAALRPLCRVPDGRSVLAGGRCLDPQGNLRPCRGHLQRDRRGRPQRSAEPVLDGLGGPVGKPHGPGGADGPGECRRQPGHDVSRVRGRALQYPDRPERTDRGIGHPAQRILSPTSPT